MNALTEVVWALVVLYGLWRWAQVVEGFTPSARNPSAIPDEVEVPEDLVALALTHSESWAQEETLRAAREKYDEYKDWNRVRMAMGVGSL